MKEASTTIQEKADWFYCKLLLMSGRCGWFRPDGYNLWIFSTPDGTRRCGMYPEDIDWSLIFQSTNIPERVLDDTRLAKYRFLYA